MNYYWYKRNNHDGVMTRIAAEDFNHAEARRKAAFPKMDFEYIMRELAIREPNHDPKYDALTDTELANLMFIYGDLKEWLDKLSVDERFEIPGNWGEDIYSDGSPFLRVKEHAEYLKKHIAKKNH